jgi:hypothetical protein
LDTLVPVLASLRYFIVLVLYLGDVKHQR